MKICIYLLMVVALGLIIYNLTFLDFDAPLAGDSGTAVVGILSSCCVLVLMLILLVSRAIAKKAEKQ